jgi:hypothetical protein
MQNFRILNSPKDTQNFRLEEHIPNMYISNISVNPRVQEISSFKDLVLFSGQKNSGNSIQAVVGSKI